LRPIAHHMSVLSLSMNLERSAPGPHWREPAGRDNGQVGSGEVLSMTVPGPWTATLPPNCIRMWCSSTSRKRKTAARTRCNPRAVQNTTVRKRRCIAPNWRLGSKRLGYESNAAGVVSRKSGHSEEYLAASESPPSADRGASHQEKSARSRRSANCCAQDTPSEAGPFPR